ncbi:MAG TPA: hypothetical protein VMS30_11445 [Phycisphaerales bacterium]|nr:hypothetical protein [Phycisphaerales bacterium]
MLPLRRSWSDSHRIVVCRLRLDGLRQPLDFVNSARREDRCRVREIRAKSIDKHGWIKATRAERPAQSTNDAEDSHLLVLEPCRRQVADPIIHREHSNGSRGNQPQIISLQKQLARPGDTEASNRSHSLQALQLLPRRHQCPKLIEAERFMNQQAVDALATQAPQRRRQALSQALGREISFVIGRAEGSPESLARGANAKIDGCRQLADGTHRNAELSCDGDVTAGQAAPDFALRHSIAIGRRKIKLGEASVDRRQHDALSIATAEHMVKMPESEDSIHSSLASRSLGRVERQFAA